jgi:pimeloyl-ACP methyl ester carboxylesterase
MSVVTRHVAAADGTRIFAALHGGGAGVALLCLPGLTRNGRDFAPVVERFAGTRAVLTVDFRGRGLSDAATDPLTYRPDVELADTLAVLAAFGLQRAALLGTSRGGIVGMIMAAQVPEMLAGLCLNDIGPRIEPEGLLRIMGYVGVDVSFPDWDAAARAYAATAPGFTGVSHTQWKAAAQRAYQQREDGRIAPHYDMKLAATLPAREDVASGKTPELWPLLPALAGKPVTCIRGDGSDLLSRATIDRLCTELSHVEAVEIAGRGHVPFLDEPDSIAGLERWLARVDAQEKGRSPGPL